jgi:hypothetical protein
MRARGIDYFENSRRATYIQQQYAMRNPRGFALYGKRCWGVSASDGPGPAERTVEGIRRSFYGYRSRGVPFGPDDGTIAPWSVVASLPFAPEIVLPAIRYLEVDLNMEDLVDYGFRAAFNGTFAKGTGGGPIWVSPWIFGLDEGPIVLMIENYRSGLLWNLTKKCVPLVNGLRRAGFAGAWL